MPIIIDTNHKTTLEAIEVWGKDAQIAILQEECAELISATARFNRGRTGGSPVAEEMADVVVSMMSVVTVMGVEEAMISCMKEKLERLQRRIDESKGI